jgi:hypothetical protein
MRVGPTDILYQCDRKTIALGLPDPGVAGTGYGGFGPSAPEKFPGGIDWLPMFGDA